MRETLTHHSLLITHNYCIDMPIIEINNLTKDYEVGFWRKRKVRALDGLSLTVEPHQIFGFLGANGAGKTTTLKLLMRLIFPTSGSVRILNRDISDVSMHVPRAGRPA